MSSPGDIKCLCTTRGGQLVTQLSRCFVTDWGRAGDQLGMEEPRGVPEEGASLPSKADLPTQGGSLGRERQLVSGGEATARCLRHQGHPAEEQKEQDRKSKDLGCDTAPYLVTNQDHTVLDQQLVCGLCLERCAVLSD